jgi:Bacterial TSP3 repeat
VDLISFTATGRAGGGVVVAWETAQEAHNKGFNLYRAEAAGGAYVKLNSGLIPAASISGEGRSYGFTDANLIRGRLYYYKLEDVDVSGAVSVHGPVCVDWDADGLPDDWEVAHGLNPAVNDAHLDRDGDGVPNWLEYQRGTDPFNPDTDGDGIPDGAEKKSPGYSGGSGSVDSGETVQVISSDSTGVTLELLTRSFDTTPVQVGGQAFERLRVPAYVHARGGQPAASVERHPARRAGGQDSGAPRALCGAPGDARLPGLSGTRAPRGGQGSVGGSVCLG